MSLTVFAAVMLMVNGGFQFLEGLAALLRSGFFVVTRTYAYRMDVAAWGWVHLLVGVGLVALGVSLLRGSTVARIAAIVLAALSAMVNFLFIPYQPIWSVIIIALDVAVIWALSGHRPDRV